MHTHASRAKLAVLTALLGGAFQDSQAADAPNLLVVARIEMRGVEGRLDHLALDSANRRLFVTATSSGTVEVVDLQSQKALHRIEGIREPQGIAFSAATGRLFVASGTDGAVQVYNGEDYSPAGTLKLGSNADNLRLDEATSLLYVGYGQGAIAAIDARTLERRGEVKFEGHPESFQLSPSDSRIYINTPDAPAAVVIADRAKWTPLGAWRTYRGQGNYPMAIDAGRGRVLVAFRKPAMVAAFKMEDGTIQTTGEVGADADDMFFDEGRKLLYVVCGAGMVDILNPADLKRVGRKQTSTGARTGLFSREDDRLYVAAPAQGKTPATIWVMRPTP